jgi:hypothetical protein
MVIRSAAYCYFTVGCFPRLSRALSLNTGSVSSDSLPTPEDAAPRPRYAVCVPEGWKKENKGIKWCPTDRQDNKKHRLSRQVYLSTWYQYTGYISRIFSLDQENAKRLARIIYGRTHRLGLLAYRCVSRIIPISLPHTDPHASERTFETALSRTSFFARVVKRSGEENSIELVSLPTFTLRTSYSIKLREYLGQDDIISNGC